MDRHGPPPCEVDVVHYLQSRVVERYPDPPLLVVVVVVFYRRFKIKTFKKGSQFQVEMLEYNSDLIQYKN